MDELTLRLAGQVIQSPHFSEEDKSRIKSLVNECSQKEEELMILRDYFNNMCIQGSKPDVPEDEARFLIREKKRINYESGRLSSDIMNIYVCGMGPVFERIVKIQN